MRITKRHEDDIALSFPQAVDIATSKSWMSLEDRVELQGALIGRLLECMVKRMDQDEAVDFLNEVFDSSVLNISAT